MVKVLDFVQLGGPDLTVDSTVSLMANTAASSPANDYANPVPSGSLVV